MHTLLAGGRSILFFAFLRSAHAALRERRLKRDCDCAVGKGFADHNLIQSEAWQGLTRKSGEKAATWGDPPLSRGAKSPFLHKIVQEGLVRNLQEAKTNSGSILNNPDSRVILKRPRPPPFRPWGEKRVPFSGVDLGNHRRTAKWTPHKD